MNGLTNHNITYRFSLSQVKDFTNLFNDHRKRVESG